jgi:hypothetical protein
MKSGPNTCLSSRVVLALAARVWLPCVPRSVTRSALGAPLDGLPPPADQQRRRLLLRETSTLALCAPRAGKSALAPGYEHGEPDGGDAEPASAPHEFETLG